MTTDYFSANGAIWDGCCVPPLSHLSNIYLSNCPYGGVIAEPKTAGFINIAPLFG